MNWVSTTWSEDVIKQASTPSCRSVYMNKAWNTPSRCWQTSGDEGRLQGRLTSTGSGSKVALTHQAEARHPTVKYHVHSVPFLSTGSPSEQPIGMIWWRFNMTNRPKKTDESQLQNPPTTKTADRRLGGRLLKEKYTKCNVFKEQTKEKTGSVYRSSQKAILGFLGTQIKITFFLMPNEFLDSLKTFKDWKWE